MDAQKHTSERPHLLLYVAQYRYRQHNAIAATLAWIAEAGGSAFEVYYDAFRLGRHYGSGEKTDFLEERGAERAGWLTGGLMSGGRHLEAVALGLQRFQTTVVCSGDVSLASTLATLAPDSGAEIMTFAEHDLALLYDRVLTSLHIDAPSEAVMLDAAPSPQLRGIDAYEYPEVRYTQALGVEASATRDMLAALRELGVRRIRTIGVAPARQSILADQGFAVSDTGLVRSGDDFASATHRIATRWKDRRRGWIIGDPVLSSYWLPLACREDRLAVFSAPQSKVIDLLRDEISATRLPAILGRQFHDSDFLSLSRLGQSFQVIDPSRPPLPVLTTLPARWSAAAHDARSSDPSDDELREHARNGRILVSLVFWTGMIREVENLYALTDLIATTGLKAGFAFTSDSFKYRPSPLDLLAVPREQGGVFPAVEILLGSSGTGVSIESLMHPQHLREHLGHALCEINSREVPVALRPEGWWSTLDVPMRPLSRWNAPMPMRMTARRPYLKVRFHSRSDDSHSKGGENGASDSSASTGARWLLRQRLGTAMRGRSLERFFEAYRPYEHFAPGPFQPQVAAAVKQAGFSYMLTKAGFGREPRLMHRDGDFVALNYTAGHWDGWTPFETVNDVRDLRRAERTLTRTRTAGWLLGTIDTCLWAFSGELWNSASRLAAIAEYAAGHGASGRLINVTPRVIARYARILDGERRAS